MRKITLKKTAANYSLQIKSQNDSKKQAVNTFIEIENISCHLCRP